MTSPVSNTSGLLSLNKGETVENRGLGAPLADSSRKTAINSLKPGTVSVFTADFKILAQEGWDVLGVDVGARVSRRVSWAGGDSEEGTSSAGSDVVGSDVICSDADGSLAGTR